MSFTIRPIRKEEIPALEQTLGYGFGGDPNPEKHADFSSILELERTRCAFDGDTLVASLGVFSFELTVPGGSLPVAGTTMVAVRGTHRRRGLLRDLMRAHLAEVREREEPLAALWASEAGIYSRFGYGPAVQLCSISIERVHADFAEALAPAGRVRLVDAE